MEPLRRHALKALFGEDGPPKVEVAELFAPLFVFAADVAAAWDAMPAMLERQGLPAE